MTNPLSRFVQHFRTPASPPVLTNVARYSVAYTRTNGAGEMPNSSASNTKADFQALSVPYDSLTGGRRSTMHFVCKGGDASICREFGNTFALRGRVTGQPFDPYAKEDLVRIGPLGVSGRNGNTGRPLTQDEQQTLISAAKFALGHGYVKSTPFAPDVRMNGL
ncbi:MAG: hypothetical protein ACRYGA_14785 [Janthinobacterium lividum]